MPADTRNGPTLHPMTEELATGAHFASVATILPSGAIQNQTVWVAVEDDPYRYAEVRGRVTDTTTGDRARTHIDELSRTYTGRDYPPENIKSERIILWVTPERQTVIDQNRGVAD